MANRIGMDPGRVESLASRLDGQLGVLASAASDASRAAQASLVPDAYGIPPGERVLAPWSIGSAQSASAQVREAIGSVNALVGRLFAEAAQQRGTSATDRGFGGGPAAGPGGSAGGQPGGDPWYSWLVTVSHWRRIIAWPRTALEFPAAVWATWRNPNNLLQHLRNPAAWFPTRAALAAGSQWTAAMRVPDAPNWIRHAYQGASNLKPWNYFDPRYLHSMAPNARPSTGYLDLLHLGASGRHAIQNPAAARTLEWLKLGGNAAGKAFGGLGVVFGVGDLVTGISEGDGWQIADGVVNTITGIASFAPPPVGPIAAGVGLAWNAGRWLFGEDANGVTGIEHIGNGLNAAADWAGDRLADAQRGAEIVGNAIGNAVSEGAEAVGDFVDKIWPW